MDELIDTYLKNKCDEIPVAYAENINKFLPLYKSIPNDDLAYLFSYMHYSYNRLFKELNRKLALNNHYNAGDSRALIEMIDLYKQLDVSFKNTQYEFEIDTIYLKTINNCETFLSSSWGSEIPSEFKKINIFEIRPIFKLLYPVTAKTTSFTKQNQDIQEINMQIEKSKVFIVHGHDNETKQEVARFIESIGLETIILHEQASRSMTIIEKIEYYSNEANFAVVLYTPCDKGRGVTETKVHARDRARQNVVFEHGYLMARIGRQNVCALVKGEIETPSDISGVVYTPLDNFGGWKIELMKELRACGYLFDLNQGMK